MRGGSEARILSRNKMDLGVKFPAVPGSTLPLHRLQRDQPLFSVASDSTVKRLSDSPLAATAV
jgi:hypothetical protein